MGISIILYPATAIESAASASFNALVELKATVNGVSPPVQSTPFLWMNFSTLRLIYVLVPVMSVKIRVGRNIANLIDSETYLND